ncbi:MULTISPECIES: glycoside hydrolase family 43 protein [unclassified Microbacterium]|uniref:glycoside hydrolase family 43 protein n=1 Tax=unclassified Microbacterium TaxID=2609290 RepID=UPI000EAAAB25|nr:MULTISPECIES: glycoside hydrolase family 43 protein [unclassified Microbacterium]MBT2486185.1 family 43 glycosylhydrolase [Microbacterium sp. ISL-108]RKN68909.1 glycoside hydrolase family 43 protein [Microbacterium sp. CGR2]
MTSTETVHTEIETSIVDSNLQAVPTSVVPVVSGFHPDPTICRVGDDYYLAHSSFEFAPGVPIWHSTDLLEWEQIGNILERDDQFGAGSAPASKGVFAPTLRHHDGRFWLITTDVSGGGGQLVVSAEHPTGPWTSGVRLRMLQGIDPDIAWDENGECFVTYCSTDPALPGIAQARVDLTAGTVREAPRPLWSGSGLAFPEAPHLYARGGWWYLLIAEGGTERGHSVSVARSRRPDGPFEGWDENPILSHRSTTHPVQNTGHADFVETPDGSWAMVYLGVRPRGVTPLFHVVGRETFLAGVDWVDGWPLVDEHRYARVPGSTDFTDRFAAGSSGRPLHPRWVSPGAALSAQIDATVASDGLALAPAIADSGALSAVVTRVRDLDWSFEVDVAVANDAGDGIGCASEAGVVLRLDDRHWYEVRLTPGSARVVARIGPLESDIGDAVAITSARATVRIEAVPSATEGPDDIRLGVVVDGSWTELARLDGRYLSTEVAGGFTGRVVGFRAISGRVWVLEARYDGRP